MPLAFLNGRFVPADELTLSFADAGFVFAATVTDFCRTYRHRLFRWPNHLARLRRDCAAVRIPLAYPDDELTAAAERLVAENAAGMATGDDWALITFATPGPLGYMLEDGGVEPRRSLGTVGMHTFPLSKERYRRFFTEGVTLALAGVVSAGLVPADVKHRSRLHWWLADQAVRDPASPYHCPGAVPVLTDANGAAADAALGTVLAVADGTVVRPRRGAVLDGISVAVVEELCGRLRLRYAEADLDFRALPAGVSEVMLTGSAFGVAGVKAVVGPGGRRDFAWPGPVFRRLLAAWNEMVGLDVAEQFGAGSAIPG